MHDKLLKEIFKNNGIILSDLKLGKYKTAKELEWAGFVYEEIEKHYFGFVSQIMSSIIFDISLETIYMPIPNAKDFSIVQLAVEAFKRISKSSLKNAFEFRQNYVSEDQWLLFCNKINFGV